MTRKTAKISTNVVYFVVCNFYKSQNDLCSNSLAGKGWGTCGTTLDIKRVKSTLDSHRFFCALSETAPTAPTCKHRTCKHTVFPLFTTVLTNPNRSSATQSGLSGQRLLMHPPYDISSSGTTPSCVVYFVVWSRAPPPHHIFSTTTYKPIIYNHKQTKSYGTFLS